MTLAVAGTTAVSLHLLLLAFNEWLIYDRISARAPDAFRDQLAEMFLITGLREGASELLALVATAAIALTLAGPSRSNAGNRRLLAVLLLSYIPLALHSMGVAGAFLTGWDLDLLVTSSATASPEDVASTVRESLPIVLAPLTAGRAAATVAASALFAALQLRVCGLPVHTATGSALVFGGLLTLARLAA